VAQQVTLVPAQVVSKLVEELLIVGADAIDLPLWTIAVSRAMSAVRAAACVVNGPAF
jgi:hypothetical protein